MSRTFDGEIIRARGPMHRDDMKTLDTLKDYLANGNAEDMADDARWLRRVFRYFEIRQHAPEME